MRFDRVGDRLALIALVAFHALLAILLVRHPGRACASDCVVEMLPRLMALARAVQAGSLPLWDPATFAGARPFWSSSGGIYHPAMFPLYLLADTGDPRQATVVLQIAPYVLHLLWGSIGGYYVARRVIKLEPIAATVMGPAFMLAPLMLDIAFVNQIQGYAFLPWVLLTSVHALERRSLTAWAIGALSVSAMTFATNPDTLNRILVVIGFQTLAYAFVTGRASVALPRRLAGLLPLLAMVAVGILTYGFGLAGLREGIAFSRRAVPSCDAIAAFTDYSSAPPSQFLSLLFPPLFIRLEAITSSGGLLSLVALSYALHRPSRLSTSMRTWATISVALGVLSAAVTAGHYLPIFGGLCRALPIFFGFPHPTRYFVGVSWALAVLTAIGVSLLARHPISRPALLLHGWPLAAGALVAWWNPSIPWVDPAVGRITLGLYVGAAAGLLAIAIMVPHRARVWLITAGILLEATSGALLLARRLPDGSTPDWADFSTWTQSIENPTTELLPLLLRTSFDHDVRFVGTRGFIDNQAWSVDRRGLLGLMARPVAQRLERALASCTLHAPFEPWLAGLPRLLPNMNVGFVIADRQPEYRRNLRVDCAPFERALRSLVVVEQTPRFEVRAIPAPLPYVYTQDKLLLADDDTQFGRLMQGDLRKASYVDAAFATAHSHLVIGADDQPPETLYGPCEAGPATISPDSAREDLRESDAAVRFRTLQEENPITLGDRSNPNRKILDVEVHRAALLVIAETWHPGWRAEVNGKAAQVWQVNYLQQGLWLEPGAHHVELRFAPEDIHWGAAISAGSFGIIAFAALLGRRSNARVSRSGLHSPRI